MTIPDAAIEAAAEAIPHDLWCDTNDRDHPQPCSCQSGHIAPAAIAAAMPAIREAIAQEIEHLPTTRTKAWDRGWDSVSLGDVLSIVRGGIP